MKKIIYAVTILVLIYIFSSCTTPKDEVLNSIGRYESEMFYTSGGFQDFTDYAKYQYESIDLKDNEYFVAMTDEDIEEFNQYIDNFQSWVTVHENNNATNELAVNYDFDRSIVDPDDYCYIYTKADETLSRRFDNYDVYFLDFQTNIVYYFHNNI